MENKIHVADPTLSQVFILNVKQEFLLTKNPN